MQGLYWEFSELYVWLLFITGSGNLMQEFWLLRLCALWMLSRLDFRSMDCQRLVKVWPFSFSLICSNNWICFDLLEFLLSCTLQKCRVYEYIGVGYRLLSYLLWVACILSITIEVH